jgi:hypothetical protein
VSGADDWGVHPFVPLGAKRIATLATSATSILASCLLANGDKGGRSRSCSAKGTAMLILHSFGLTSYPNAGMLRLYVYPGSQRPPGTLARHPGSADPAHTDLWIAAWPRDRAQSNKRPRKSCWWNTERPIPPSSGWRNEAGSPPNGALPQITGRRAFVP